MADEDVGRRNFGRDVLVNVIANLIAASIIYLLAAATGLLPREQLVLVVAWTILVATFATLGLLFFGIKRWVIRHEWQDGVRAFGLGACAVYLAVCWVWVGLPWLHGGWVLVLFFVGTAIYSARYARLAWKGWRQRAAHPAHDEAAAPSTDGTEQSDQASQ